MTSTVTGRRRQQGPAAEHRYPAAPLPVSPRVRQTTTATGRRRPMVRAPEPQFRAPHSRAKLPARRITPATGPRVPQRAREPRLIAARLPRQVPALQTTTARGAPRVRRVPARQPRAASCRKRSVRCSPVAAGASENPLPL